MGAFYGTILIDGASTDDVLRTVQAMQRTAFVIGVQPQRTLIYDEAIQGFDDSVNLATFAATLSNELSTTVISALNHDDDILGLSLIQNGIDVDFYLSDPDLANVEDGTVGDAGAWCNALNVPWVEKDIRELFENDSFTVESERHAEIARVLGWPDAVVGYSFDQLDAGETPDGFDAGQIYRVGPAG